MRRLVLWDIDGTLVIGGDIGAEIFDRAIERTLGSRPPSRVRMSGKTDPQIVGEYLAMLGREDETDHIGVILGHLERELAEAEHLVREHGRVLPGVAEILPMLAGDPDFTQSVVTGNIAPNALVKLAAFSLDKCLDLEIGAFGSDHADRKELVPIALERAERLRGRRFRPDQVWVVGDSDNDLACARAAGVRCLLVGTGRASVDELQRLGPDAVRADLADVEEICALLRS